MSIEMSSVPRVTERRETQEFVSVQVVDASEASENSSKVLTAVPAGEEKPIVRENNDKSDQKLKPEDIEQALSNLNDYTQNLQRELNFSIDEDTNRTVIKVIDSESEKVIREIPSKEILAISRSIDEFSENMKGILLYTQV